MPRIGISQRRCNVYLIRQCIGQAACRLYWTYIAQLKYWEYQCAATSQCFLLDAHRATAPLCRALRDVSMELGAPGDDDRRSTFERTLRGTGAVYFRFTLVHVSHHVSISIVWTGTPRQGACCWCSHPFNSLACIARSRWDEGACCALWASRCDFRDPGWGDPGFRNVMCCFCTFPGPICDCVCFGSCLFYLMARAHFSTQAAVLICIEHYCPHDDVFLFSLLCLFAVCGCFFGCVFCGGFSWFLGWVALHRTWTDTGLRKGPPALF